MDGAGALVGTYYLRPNSLCLGAHVANAGHVVASTSHRQLGYVDALVMFQGLVEGQAP